MAVIENCRLCKSDKLQHVCDFGTCPVSHNLRRHPSDADHSIDIQLVVCASCGLLQLESAAPAKLLYAGSDTYMTGFQRPKHLPDLIVSLNALQDPGPTIDVGCNDGSLMVKLHEAGFDRLVGIDPNRAATGLARALGHPIYTDFLTEALAGEIVGKHGRFQSVFCRHVLEHVDDLSGFFASLRQLLADDGLLVAEVPFLEHAMQLGNPTVIWEEHVSYFLEAQFRYLFERHGFEIVESRRYAFGGGSMAVIARKMQEQASVAPPTPEPSLALIRTFVERLERYKAKLQTLVATAKHQGYMIAMYGAAPRSCIIAGYAGILQAIDLVIDDREDIAGRIWPGTDLPILPLDAAMNGSDSRILCLLGVGAENEFKVRHRVENRLETRCVFASLFPPRDAVRSMETATETVRSSALNVASL